MDGVTAIWKCRRCGQIVDLAAMRCGCATSPSPWEHINAPGSERAAGVDLKPLDEEPPKSLNNQAQRPLADSDAGRKGNRE